MSKVGIIMGSKSDLPVMQEAIDILKGFDIVVEVDIVSAHRTPEKMFDYGKNAHTRGFSVIIAGAGGAARKPCRTARRVPVRGRRPARGSLRRSGGRRRRPRRHPERTLRLRPADRQPAGGKARRGSPVRNRRKLPGRARSGRQYSDAGRMRGPHHQDRRGRQDQL